MNAPLRRAGVVMMILFGLLFANLNWIQVYKAEAYHQQYAERTGHHGCPIRVPVDSL